MTKFCILTAIILLIGMTTLKGQDSLTSDPLLQFKNFIEIGVSLNATRVNTEFTTFGTKKGIYNFEKGKYLPSFDGILNYGWFFKDKDNEILTLKTGINITSKVANLIDSVGTDLKYSESFIQIPLQIGLRQPKKFNTVKNNLFHAIEFNVGLYVAIPIMEKLDLKNNIDQQGSTSFGNYFRFGFIGEFLFSQLNKKGYGNKFGLRVAVDINSIAKFKETKYQLYPYYNSVGVFYVIVNRHK